MKQLKCTECGQIFSEKLTDCPNCGCPVNGDTERIMESTQMEDIDGQSNQNTYFQQPYQHPVDQIPSDDDFVTTDTGVENENIIKTYAKVIWIVAVVIAAIAELGIIVSAAGLMKEYPRSASFAFLSIIMGTVVVGLFLLAVYVIRAFIMVVHNISINVHEINMKVK